MPSNKTKLKVWDIEQDKKTLSVVSDQLSIPIPTNLFKGEVLQCYICKEEITTSPNTETNWYCLQNQRTKKTLSLCPNCQQNPDNIHETIDAIIEAPTRLVLFQGESAREFPLTPEILAALSRILVKSMEDK
jgi:hypothetical protein